MSNPTGKEKVARRPTGDEQPLPTKKDTDTAPIIPPASSGPNRVLIVGDLAGFQAEVPAPATVRLFASEETEHSQMITWLKCKIDLMARST